MRGWSEFIVFDVGDGDVGESDLMFLLTEF